MGDEDDEGLGVVAALPLLLEGHYPLLPSTVVKERREGENMIMSPKKKKNEEDDMKKEGVGEHVVDSKVAVVRAVAEEEGAVAELCRQRLKLARQQFFQRAHSVAEPQWQPPARPKLATSQQGLVSLVNLHCDSDGCRAGAQAPAAGSG